VFLKSSVELLSFKLLRILQELQRKSVIHIFKSKSDSAVGKREIRPSLYFSRGRETVGLSQSQFFYSASTDVYEGDL